MRLTKEYLEGVFALTRRQNAEGLEHKILLAILAALTVIGGAVLYQRYQTQKAAAILQVQQDDAEYQKQENNKFREKVEADKKRHSSAAAHEGKTWKTYLP